MAEKRLIEAGFPCHQVGAETQRERDTGKAPPTHRLHVWWARRPLTPSRAAILGSILPVDADPNEFLMELGITKKQVDINGKRWTLVGKAAEMIESDQYGQEFLPVTPNLAKAFQNEIQRREKVRQTIQQINHTDHSLANDPVLKRWLSDNQELHTGELGIVNSLPILKVPADPAFVNELIAVASSANVQSILGTIIRIDPEDLYGYGRAYETKIQLKNPNITILDPTSGGGSIPFESLRLGFSTVANDLNPVASVIQKATLEYPAKFGESLYQSINKYGKLLEKSVNNDMTPFSPMSPLNNEEKAALVKACKSDNSLFEKYCKSESDQTGFLYCRMVTCPHCHGQAPLLNASWLAKSGDKWAVRIIPDGQKRNGTVRFEPFRFTGSHGPNGEDPDFSTVDRGVGTCIHCKQAISAEEIKAQACGTSSHGTWWDQLYCVAAVRYQPKLDKKGQPERFKSGAQAGQIKTEKVSFFRSPTDLDFAALERAKKELESRWEAWERQGIIPTEKFPEGNDMRPVTYGMPRWCDMFTPRQLLGHLIAIETLNSLKPQIITDLGSEKGKAVVTYLQFMIDKCLDYNSRQTRWIPQRASLSGTFGRHDFSLKWTFGEMIFAGPNSGLAWGLSQILDAYAGIVDLLPPNIQTDVKILNGSAANMDVPAASVDVICMDPPYYNNVQYAELSDYFYVWQKRTLSDLYPDLFSRRLTNKKDEAVANPVREGSAKKADREYERLMTEIFAECKRVLKPDGIMTVMFTHKSQEAWQTLTQALIESGWSITSSFPVDSEFAASMHQKDMAAAASSIFIACRPREQKSTASIWTGFGGTGVAQKVRQAVRQGLTEFESLHLNPVDEMVASYGRALQVLSEHWPVVDGDDLVTPVRAMTEASAVVAQYQMTRLTRGRLNVSDIGSESSIALTLFGVFGLGSIPFDDVLSLAKSLNISLENKMGGYSVSDRMVGINQEQSSRSSRQAEDAGYYAPLVRKGSKLRLVRPEERNSKRISDPKSEWDKLHGLILAYREGDIPVVRAYLQKHAAGKEQLMIDLLAVWSDNVGDEKLKKEAERILYGLKL